MNNGDKVICVDASPSHCKCCTGMVCPLILGNVYVVKRTGQTSTGKPYVEVIGVNLSHHHYVFGFDPSRFRLLSEMKAQRSTGSVAYLIAIGRLTDPAKCGKLDK